MPGPDPALGAQPVLGAPAPVPDPPEPIVGPTDTPMVAAQPAGTLAQAVVAPASGPIPSGHDAVVVRVKEWWESSTIRVVLGSLVGIAMEAAAEFILHALSSDAPFNWASLWKNVLGAVVVGFLGIRRGTDNSVIRKLPFSSAK